MKAWADVAEIGWTWMAGQTLLSKAWHPFWFLYALCLRREGSCVGPQVTPMADFLFCPRGTGSPSPHHLGITAPPVMPSLSSLDQELKLQDWCCNQTGSPPFCALYGQKRPKIGCDGYRPSNLSEFLWLRTGEQGIPCSQPA